MIRVKPLRAIVGALRLPAFAWSFTRPGYERHARSFVAAELTTSLAGKVCVVTGANQGIGLAVARGLAARDADVWLLCRNRARGEVAARQVARCGRGRVELELVDMSDLGSVRAAAARLGLAGIDVLVHNAGSLVHEHVTTADGLEQTFALHVVGPELLTRRLLQPLRARHGRVIYVASGGMYAERLDVGALLSPPAPFDGVRAYAVAKRAQVVLAQMWAEREPGVNFYAMHPGWVETGGVQSALPRFYRLTRPILRTSEQGADTAVWLAGIPTPRVPSGAFVFDRAEAPRYPLPGTTETSEQRERLWSVIAERCE